MPNEVIANHQSCQLNVDGWSGIILVSNCKGEDAMNEKQADKVIELLGEIRDELKKITSEAGSINSNTDYTYNVKTIADDILELLKEKMN